MVLLGERGMRCTRLLDLDGCVVAHCGGLPDILKKPSYLLPGVLEKFLEWRANDDYIVLTTARSESLRRFTEEQLTGYGLFWDQLVMGLPTGPRYLYNDIKPETEDFGEMLTAFAVNLRRNVGLIQLDEE